IACTSPGFTVRSIPFRIFLPSTSACRFLISSMLFPGRRRGSRPVGLSVAAAFTQFVVLRARIEALQHPARSLRHIGGFVVLTREVLYRLDRVETHQRDELHFVRKRAPEQLYPTEATH